MTLVSPKKASDYFESKLEFTVGPIELDGMIRTGENIRIIDVRMIDDYEEGHIPCAINLPKGKWVTFEGLDHNKVNVIYCYSEACHLAAAGAKFFADHGYSVMELEGGFETWEDCHLPIET